MKKAIRNDFGNNLKILRLGHNLTLKELAKEVETTKGYLSRIENGKLCNPSFILMWKLSRVLDCSMEDLYF